MAIVTLFLIRKTYCCGAVCMHGIYVCVLWYISIYGMYLSIYALWMELFQYNFGILLFFILASSTYPIPQFWGLGVYRLFEKHCAPCFVYFILFYLSLWWICIITEGEVAHSVQMWTRPHWFPGSGYLYKAQHDLRQKLLRTVIFACITFVA